MLENLNWFNGVFSAVAGGSTLQTATDGTVREVIVTS
jgi:hypothetical protein